jgi:hypothetical protein
LQKITTAAFPGQEFGLDKPVSTGTVESVEAACRKFLAGRGMKFKWTGYGTKQVKK